MHDIGTIKYGRDINKRPPTDKFAWLLCPRCNSARWVRLIRNNPTSKYCKQCHKEATYKKPLIRLKENHPRWKGGRLITSEGYILIYVEPSNPFYCMARKSLKGKDYVFEHRLVMAIHLNRPLLSQERVHHLNGIKNDNRIENLELLASVGEHITLHNKGYREGYRKGYEDGQQTRIQDLLTEIRLLRLKLENKNCVR